MRRKVWVVATAVLVSALAVSACSHSSESASSGLGRGSIATEAPAPAASSAAIGAGGSVEGSNTDNNSTENGDTDGTSAGASSSSAPKAASAGATLLTGQALIRTADLSVQVTNVAAQADHARAITTAAGGSVDGDDRSSGPSAQATLTLRVPPAALPATLTSLSKLGHELSRQLSTQDVTATVADVDSRVASAAAAIDQLRDLYGKAVRVSDIIEVETQLAQREADLESLQAQQRALTTQVAMAAVTLRLSTHAVAAAHRPSHRGGFAAGWHAFSTTVGAVAVAVATALPFLVVALVLGLGALYGRRHINRRRGVPPNAASLDA